MFFKVSASKLCLGTLLLSLATTATAQNVRQVLTMTSKLKEQGAAEDQFRSSSASSTNGELKAAVIVENRQLADQLAAIQRLRLKFLQDIESPEIQSLSSDNKELFVKRWIEIALGSKDEILLRNSELLGALMRSGKLSKAQIEKLNKIGIKGDGQSAQYAPSSVATSNGAALLDLSGPLARDTEWMIRQTPTVEKCKVIEEDYVRKVENLKVVNADLVKNFESKVLPLVSKLRAKKIMKEPLSVHVTESGEKILQDATQIRAELSRLAFETVEDPEAKKILIDLSILQPLIAQYGDYEEAVNSANMNRASVGVCAAKVAARNESLTQATKEGAGKKEFTALYENAQEAYVTASERKSAFPARLGSKSH